MCGIAGMVGGPPEAAGEVVRRMTDALAHRGPDDSGLHVREGVAFGHRRLSILDPSDAGHQPMLSDDGSLALTYNGEIYNFRALRSELEREGVRFRGGSDTEVLLRAWEREGPRILERLRGMYAFAVWNRDRRTVHLARDPCGIKPLYLFEDGGTLLFASEVRALLASGRVARRLSTEAVGSYLRYGAITEPLTAVEGVTALPAGAVVEIALEADTARISASHFHGCEPFGAPEAYLPDRLSSTTRVRAVLADSVEQHLVSDVPVAFFLSGGIDSSAIVALAAERSARPVNTFTVTFAETELSEAPYAREVARRFGTDHREICLRPEELLDALPGAYAAMDQPSIDGVNTFVISRAVREAGFKVVASGLGGDELFAGYRAFRHLDAVSGVWRAAGPVRRGLGRFVGASDRERREKLALALSESDPARGIHLAARSLFGPRMAGRLGRGAEAPERPAAPDGLSPLWRLSWYELTGYMRNTLLRDADAFSMAHGLELRVPFVDREVARVAAAVPDRYKLERGVSKPLIVHGLGDRLPEATWKRPKRGFGLPFAQWLHGELAESVSGSFRPERLESVGICRDAAAQVWTRFRTGSTTWSRPWALHTLVRWAEENGVEVDASSGPAVASYRNPMAVET